MDKSELLKIAKPILFNTEMVRAILDGRKTVTRRVVKPQPYHDSIIKFSGGMEVAVDETATLYNNRAFRYTPKFLPYRIKTGKGDILYVRETWTTDPHGVDLIAITNGTMPVYYKADYNEKELDDWFGSVWKPSIHMPKEAARIFLKITDVRCERLQEITVEQALKEGFKSAYEFNVLWDCTIPKQKQLSLYDCENQKYASDYSWQANPWVWVYEFEKLEVENG